MKLSTKSKSATKPTPVKLKFNKRSKNPTLRLPYTSKLSDKPFGFSHWAVPRAGGYYGGCMTGEALARIYLQEMRNDSRDVGGGLQRVALDMLQIDGIESEELDSLRGQIVGFFSELERWIVPAARQLDDGLREQSSDELLNKANEGLSLSDAEWIELYEKKIELEDATQ